MACAEGDESDKSWLSTFKHQIDSETFTWICETLLKRINFVPGSKNLNLMFNSVQFTCQTETGRMLYEKRSARMLFQKGRKKEDKLDTVRKVKIRCKNRLLLWLWPLFTWFLIKLLSLRFRLPVCLVCRSYHTCKLGFSGYKIHVSVGFSTTFTQLNCCQLKINSSEIHIKLDMSKLFSTVILSVYPQCLKTFLDLQL